jgi:hypothetical protein
VNCDFDSFDNRNTNLENLKPVGTILHSLLPSWMNRILIQGRRFGTLHT